MPRNCSGLMVYGGTFDPPHYFHAVGPLVACQRVLGPRGWLLYVPAARNPLKAAAMASDAHRLAMLRLALDIPGRWSVWTDELDRADGKPSYTIDTLRRLRKVVGEAMPIRLLMGADQAAGFHRWKNARAILKLATPSVMLREPIATPDALYVALAETGAWTVAEVAAWVSWIAPTPVLPAASTDLRAALAAAPRDDVEAWEDDEVLDAITRPVAEYIVEQGLYKA